MMMMEMKLEIPDVRRRRSDPETQESMTYDLQRKMMGLSLCESPLVVDISKKRRERVGSLNGNKKNFKKQSNKLKIRVDVSDFCLDDFLIENVDFCLDENVCSLRCPELEPTGSAAAVRWPQLEDRWVSMPCLSS